jgi:hypothetical protein
MARAVSTDPLRPISSASAIHVRRRSSSSTPSPITSRTMDAQVDVIGGVARSADSASFSHDSRLITTPAGRGRLGGGLIRVEQAGAGGCRGWRGLAGWEVAATAVRAAPGAPRPAPAAPFAERLLMARLMTRPTISLCPWLSSSLAAVIQMEGSVGTAWRALFSTCAGEARGFGSEAAGEDGVAGYAGSTAHAACPSTAHHPQRNVSVGGSIAWNPLQNHRPPVHASFAHPTTPTPRAPSWRCHSSPAARGPATAPRAAGSTPPHATAARARRPRWPAPPRPSTAARCAVAGAGWRAGRWARRGAAVGSPGQGGPKGTTLSGRCSTARPPWARARLR